MPRRLRLIFVVTTIAFACMGACLLPIHLHLPTQIYDNLAFSSSKKHLAGSYFRFFKESTDKPAHQVGYIRVWDFDNANSSDLTDPELGPQTALIFVPNENRMVSCGAGVELWSLADNGQWNRSSSLNLIASWSLSFDEKGKILASSSESCVSAFDFGAKKLLYSFCLDEGEGPITPAAISKDGRKIVWGTEAGNLRLIDFEKQQTVFKSGSGHGDVCVVECVNDIAISGGTSGYCIWQVQESSLRREAIFATDSRVISSRICPEKRRIAVGCCGSLIIRDLDKPYTLLSETTIWGARSVAFSDDLDLCAVASEFGGVSIYKLSGDVWRYSQAVY